MMVRCSSCLWARRIADEVRLHLSQENKEIVNALERRGFSLDEFCYCERIGYVESVIMNRFCEEYESK